MKHVFVSGGTGYIGRALISRLVARGHSVTALARKGSEHKVPPGCAVRIGNALDPQTFSAAGFDTFIHLVGTPHPAPWKAAQFRSIDLPSLRASATSAVRDRLEHFIFLSVAQPAPIMRSYIQVRAQRERIILAVGLHSTILRPWYVLGPGHRWPAFLVPFYWLAARFKKTRDGARRLGLVRLDQLIDTLVWAVEHPASETRRLGVQQIVELSRVASHM